MEELPSLEKPDEVECRPSDVEIGKPGIWCIKKIKEGTLFGPYCGEIVVHDKQGLLDYRYAWQVWDLDSDKLLYIINAGKKNTGNWMKYVNCARYFEEQNIVSVQINNDIYYKAIKDIEIGEELLTWFNLSDKNSSQDDLSILPMEEEKKENTKVPLSPKKSSKKSPVKASSTQTSPSKTKIASISPSAAKRKSSSNMDTSTSNSKKQKFVQTKMNFKISKKSRDKSKKNVENETALNGMNGYTTEEVARQLPSIDDDKIFRFHTQKKHHFVQDGKKMYKCELCSVVYKRPFSLKRHFLRSHINCMYLCETDVTNCCIDLNDQLMQIENAQELQASGSRLFNGLIRSHISSPMQDAKLSESDPKLNKKDSKIQEIDFSFPGLFKCNDCFFVFDDSNDLIAHFKCHDTKTGKKTPQRRQSTEKKYNSKQKKSPTLPYSLKESFDSLHISDMSEATKHLTSSKKTSVKSSMKISPSKRVSPHESKKLPQETKTCPVSPSRLSKVKSPNTDGVDVLKGKEKLTVSVTPTKKSYPNLIKPVKRSPSKTKLDSGNNNKQKSTDSPTKSLHSLKSPGRGETPVKSTPQKNSPSKTTSKSPVIEPSRKSSLRSRRESNSRSPVKRDFNSGEKRQNVGTPKKSPLKSPGRRSNFSSPFSPKRRFGNKSPRRSSSRSPIKRKARGSKYMKTEFKKFSCTKCKVKFSRKANLDKHLKEHTENKTYPCYICGKQFMSETKMKQHIRYHFSQNVRCRHCDLKFPNVGAMRQHLTETHQDVWLINNKTLDNTDETGKSKKKTGQRPHKDKIKVVSDLDFRSKEALSELPKPESIIPKSATKSLSTPASHANFKVLSSPVAASKKKNAALDNSPAPNGYKSKLRYCCYTCKKRFISYYALVQHRRTNHRYNIFSAPSMLLHMKQKVSEEKNPLGNMPMLSPPVTPDPYYETVPENVSNNWSSHIDGKSDALKNYRKHIQIKGYRSVHTVAQYKPDAFNWSSYNFPFHYEPYESVIGYSSYKPQPIIGEDLSLNNSITDSMLNKVKCTPLKLDISLAEAAPILPCMTSPLQQTLLRRFSNDSDSKSMPSLSPTCQNNKFFSDVTESDSIPKDRVLDTCKDDSKSSPTSSSGTGTEEDSARKSNEDQSALNKTQVLKNIGNESFVPTLQYLKLVKTSDRETIEHSLHAASKATPAQAFQSDFTDILKTQSWDGYYSDIEFGKLGDIVNVCSICYRYFDSEESLVRHQWTRHSSMNCRHLQMEKGHEIDNLFYPWPRNEGMVASSTPVPEDCHTLESYKCSYCKSSFKNTNRLHVHIISCDPKKLYYVEKMSVKERRKQEAKERKATAQNIGSSKKKSATSEMKLKLDKRRKKEKLKKLIREKQTAVSPAKKKLPVDTNKTRQGLSPRSLREVRRNEMDLLSNSDSRVTRQRKRKNYELLYVPKNHVRRRTSTKVVETHQCGGCSSKFRTLFLLERHARKCSEKDKLVFNASIEDHDVNVNSQTQACEFCNKKFTYVKSLANHYKNFCPVKKQKLANEEIEEATLIESESKFETMNDEEDANDRSEEPSKRRCGWPKGLKRKNRRKNHSWTITKRKKTSSDDSDINMDKNDHEGEENEIVKDSIQDEVEQDLFINPDATNIILDYNKTDDEPSTRSNHEEVTEDSSTKTVNVLEIKESAECSEETAPPMNIRTNKEMPANNSAQNDKILAKENLPVCVEVEPVSNNHTETSISLDYLEIPVPKKHSIEKNQGPSTEPDQNITVQLLFQCSNTKFNEKLEATQSEPGCYVELNPSDIADNGYHSDNSNSNSNSKSANLEAPLINGHSALETNINSERELPCLNENTTFYKSSSENGQSCTSDFNGSSSTDNTPPVMLDNPVSYFSKQSVESICVNPKRHQKVGLFENNKPSLESTDSSVLYENGINSRGTIENPSKEVNKTSIPYQNGDENSEMSSECDHMVESDQNGFYSADTETDTDIVCYNGDTDSEESVISKIITTD